MAETQRPIFELELPISVAHGFVFSGLDEQDQKETTEFDHVGLSDHFNLAFRPLVNIVNNRRLALFFDLGGEFKTMGTRAGDSQVVALLAGLGFRIRDERGNPDVEMRLLTTRGNDVVSDTEGKAWDDGWVRLEVAPYLSNRLSLGGFFSFPVYGIHAAHKDDIGDARSVILGAVLTYHPLVK